MEMLRCLKMMEMNANSKVQDPSVLKQHTNKSFLIENHKAGMEYLETNFAECNVQQTVTPDIKSSGVVPLIAKNRVHLKDLLKYVNEPIIGKFLLCRTICPPYKITALFTVVDDPDGTLAAKILLYNFIPNVSHMRNEDVYHYLPVGTILAIMNPWFKPTADKGFAVRCDNPSHVVILNPLKIDEIFGGLTWEAQIPIEYQRNEPTIGDKTTEEWKKMGNDHYAAKRFKESVTAYTNGIDSETIKSKLGLDLLSNRSAAYLKLCNYNLALVDAQSVLDVDKGHIKCIFRKANALFGMARYKDAVSFLSNASVEQSSENKKVIDDLISKGETFIAQSDTGYYPWDNIAKMEFQNHCHDLAEYEGSVVVKDSPNKGRGLFATETIRAGQLILASKAFAYVVASNEAGIFLNSKDTKCIKTRSQTQLVTSIAQILNNCPEKCTEFYSLYGGANYSNKLSSEDFQVDVKRIEEICRYNSFGTGGFGNAAKDDVSGIWISPAFINHSCVDANSLWTLNGNFLFVRAFNDIAKGDEISISYLSPFHSVLQKNLDKYGFICDCRLCKRDRLDSPKIQSYRSDLQSKLAKGLEQKVKDQAYFNFIEEQEVSKLLRLLDKSREDAPELNIFFLSDIKTLALIYFENELYSSSASTLANVYNVSKSVASLWDFTLTIVINIIASYLMSGGDKHQALPWFEILKRYAILYCGSLNCIEVRAPNSVVMFEDYGLYLHG